MTSYSTTWGKDALALEEWPLLVRELIRQGIVKDEAEAIRRLEAGEKITVNLPVTSTEWHGIYGTSE